jgi:hypothetical protein
MEVLILADSIIRLHAGACQQSPHSSYCTAALIVYTLLHRQVFGCIVQYSTVLSLPISEIELSRSTQNQNSRWNWKMLLQPPLKQFHLEFFMRGPAQWTFTFSFCKVEAKQKVKLHFTDSSIVLGSYLVRFDRECKGIWYANEEKTGVKNLMWPPSHPSHSIEIWIPTF